MSGRYTSFAVELEGALGVAQQLSDVPGRILKAQRRALGTLRRRLAPEAKRDIQAEYNLKAGRIAEGLAVRDSAEGIRLIGRSRGINAAQFGVRARGKNRAASFAIKRIDDRTHDGSAFVGVGLSNNRLVFWRGSNKFVGRHLHRVKEAHYLPNVGKWREPLTAIYGPSVGQMLKHGRRPERLAEFAVRVLEAEQRRLLGTR